MGHCEAPIVEWREEGKNLLYDHTFVWFCANGHHGFVGWVDE